MSSANAFVPTRRLISAQVAAILKKDSRAPAVGIRAEAPGDLGDTLHVGERELPVAHCGSVLEVRERLSTMNADEGPLVIVADLEDRELGFDVLARLAKRRLFAIDPWQLVKEQFRAQNVDGQITRHDWIPRAILEASPDGAVAPVPSGFLSADTTWRFLFEKTLGVPGGHRDAVSLLEWSLDRDNVGRLRQLDDEVRNGLLGALSDPPAAAVLGCLAKDQGVHPVAIGLAARVLFDGSAAAERAIGRLERHLWKPLEAPTALAWAEAAETVVDRRLTYGLEEARLWLEQADDLLTKLGAEELTPASRFLLSSWNVRLDRFGDALEVAVAKPEASALVAASKAANQVFEHAVAKSSAPRVEQARMALRLARWLGSQDAAAPATSFAEAAESYRRDGGYVDWARVSIWEGDGRPALARAYERLASAVRERRQRQNERFGGLLAEWGRAGVFRDNALPVERVLDEVVTPLAKVCPVLVVIIDGMSVPVYRELFGDVLAHGFTERVEEELAARRAVIAALPSVTELSRASLLCGKLVSGGQGVEKDGFGGHEGLRSASKPGKAPLLLHKGDLQDAQSRTLSSTLRGALLDREQQVVGVVINAVDDHLGAGDQVRVSWNCRTIRPLEELVDAAREADRAIVLVSDHGHVSERDLEYRSTDGARERWREASGEPAADEVLLEGPRVLAGRGGKIIAPWSETVRYAPKKNGYHGGASPQEVVIPLAVVAPTSVVDLPGWTEVPAEMPEWWSAEPVLAEPERTPVRKRQPEPDGQIGLFGGEPETSWVESLFASETFRQQRELNKRVKLEDERIRALLLALDERGKLSKTALAQRIEVPMIRLQGIVTALRRLLNVEGYDVIGVDEASDTVSLDRALLFRQFELEED